MPPLLDDSQFDSGPIATADFTAEHDPRKAPSDLAQRALDIVVGAVSVLIAAPILVLSMLAVKCKSRGPVIYTPPRRYGRPFIIYKLRSMTRLQKQSGSKMFTRGDTVSLGWDPFWKTRS